MPHRRTREAIAGVLASIAIAITLAGCSAAGGAHALFDSSVDHPAKSTEQSPSATPSPTPVITTKDVATQEAIPFESSTVNDATVAQGVSTITVAGVAGVLTTTTRVTYVDGKETTREQISQVVTTPPVTQVTAVGTYVAPAPVVAGGGATALCNDGSLSYAAHHQGACSHHGGVAQFYK